MICNTCKHWKPLPGYAGRAHGCYCKLDTGRPPRRSEDGEECSTYEMSLAVKEQLAMMLERYGDTL